MNYAIVSADVKDAEVLTKIAFDSKGSWGYPPQWLELWRSEIEVSEESVRNDTIFKAIDQNREILGFYRLSGKGEKLTLSGFWVLPVHMGKGIGRALFLHMLDTAKKMHATLIEWESDPNSVSFYLHMGAEQIGEKVYILDGKERKLPILQKSL